MHTNPIRILSFFLALNSFQVLFSQAPTDYFDANNPNIKYLEHLIKKGVDEVREDLNLSKLANDSILYIAANDHADFLEQFGRLSHFQVQNRSKRTPQLRAEFFGAVNYNVGENIAMTSYGSSVKMKSGREISTKTYQGIAESLVVGWVNSPGHYKNIITTEYEITGLSISIDKNKGEIYACQKFAHVDMRFIFEENTTLFPYSNYTPPKQVSSFEEVSNELIEKYNYPYKLKHNKLEKCASCPDKFSESPDISLEYNERSGFVLRVENAEYINKLIRNRKYGLAVEIVDYEDYACGSPFYYKKPSRRNGQIRLNGTLLKPKYRKELFKGYKKRKLNEHIKFFPYIFRKDSVNFFRRFGQYKADKYTSEYYEIRLGKLPRYGPRLFNHNLVVIKDNQICDIYYFTSYCSDVYEEYMETAIIPYKFDDFNYGFQLSSDSINFTIPFQQGQYSFEKDTILKNISRLSDYDFYIDSVRIKAFSSVEGDSAVNADLQIKRGENIAAIFQGIQDQEIEKKITTAINWKGLRRALSQNKNTSAILRQSNQDLLEEINRSPKKYETQLAKSRKGLVKVYFHVTPNLKSLDYYIKKELNTLKEEITTKSRKREDYTDQLEKMTDLYRYTYSMIKRGHLKPSFFLDIELPLIKDKHSELLQYYLLFGFEYPTVFKQLKNWKQDSVYYLDKFKQMIDEPLIPEMNYLTVKMISEDLIESKSISEKQLKILSKKVKHLRKYYEEFEIARENIDKINFNLNMLALNHYFNSSPADNQKNAVMALSQVYEYYEEKELINDTLALNLAKMAIFYQNVGLGINFVYPYQNENEVIKAFINENSYTHVSDPYSAFYYEQLIDDSFDMPTEDWCNMFIKPCGIPFQAFDHEALRNRYCEICVGKNDYLKEIFNEIID